MKGCPQLEALDEYPVSLPYRGFVAPEAKMVPDSPTSLHASQPRSEQKDTPTTRKFNSIRRQLREHEALLNEIGRLPRPAQVSRILDEIRHLQTRVEYQGNALDAFHAQNEVDQEYLQDSMRFMETSLLQSIEVKVNEAVRRESTVQAMRFEGVAAKACEEREEVRRAGTWDLSDEVDCIGKALTGLEEKVARLELLKGGVLERNAGVAVHGEKQESPLEEGEIREGAVGSVEQPQMKEAQARSAKSKDAEEHGPCRRSPRKRKTRDSSGGEKPLEKKRSLPLRRPRC